VTAVAAAMLVLAGGCFFVRMAVGPTLADRMIGVNGLLLVGMSGVGVHAVASGRGAFLPALVVASLFGFVSTTMVARYIERTGR
jgi:multicomponent Na+:H+ antiporter subunit F